MILTRLMTKYGKWKLIEIKTFRCIGKPIKQVKVITKIAVKSEKSA